MDQQAQPYGLAARLSIGLTGFLFGAIVLGLFLADVQLRYNSVIDAAKKDTLNYANMLAEHTALTFGNIDRALREAETVRRNQLQGAYTEPDAAHWALRHIAQSSPALVAIGWTDAAGNLLAHSYDHAPPRASIADKAHFIAQRDHDAGLFVAPPYRSAASDRWLSAVSRRLNNPDGSFAGVVTAPIDQSYFNAFYRSVDLGSGGSITLVHRDGTILVREPAVAGAIGKSLAETTLFSGLLTRFDSGSLESVSPIDGVGRIVGYKSVPGLPLVVLVTRARAEVLARWQHSLYVFTPIVATIVLAVLIGTSLLLRQTRSLAAQTRALADSAASLEQTNIWFDAALSNMSQGLCLFDAERRVVIANRRFREIYGYPEELVRPGTALEQLLEHQSARLGDSGKTLDQLVAAVTSERNETFATRDGRVISIVRTPTPDGGWVATHDDVTEQKHAEQLVLAKAEELQLLNQRFDIALRSMSQGLCLFDAGQRLVICNERFREIYGYPEELVRPGTPLKTILAHLVSRGARQGDMTVDEYSEDLRNKHNETFFNLDGRIISIVRTPTADGGWVATHEDVTEQKRSERLLAERAAELKAVNERFDAAINNMSQGLCLIDADHRVLMSNHRFSEIYGLPPEMMQPGLSGQALIQEIAARGFTPDDMSVEEFEELAPDRRSQLIISEDGRTISIARTPIPGGGWIATHEDITERRRAERELAGNAAALKQANERFEVAINNMSQGVALFDAEQRIVVANRSYAELYHLAADQVKAGTTLQQILDYRLAAGTNFAVAPDVYRSVNVRKQHEVQELANGRIVSISRRMLSDGGWLTTHEDITDRAQSERRIAYMAQHDMLTGLANRAQFAEKLDEIRKRNDRHGSGYTLLMLDLDRFKAVNDTLGHAAGDQLLKEVAVRLKGSLRETDVLARLGGDEFAVIQDGEVDQRQAAITVARRIIEVIGKPFDLDGHRVSVGTSIGIAFAPEHGEDPDELLKRADLALYAAKGAGRNDYRIFGSDMVRITDAPSTAPEPARSPRKSRRGSAVGLSR